MGQIGSWIALNGLFVLLLPFLYFSALIRRGQIGALYIPDRMERRGPFLGMVGCYAAGLLALALAHAPRIMTIALAIYIANLIVMTAITLLWKISFHAMGVGASAIILLRTFGLQSWPVLGLIPLIGWARVQARAHTIPQVLTGTLLGGATADWLWKTLSRMPW